MYLDTDLRENPKIMNSALPMESILDLNSGKFSREIAVLPDSKGQLTTTTVKENGLTDLLHYHEKLHLSFVLNGGIIDKRQTSETERVSGELMFFHAGEPHQTIYKLFPTTSINLELSNFLFSEKPIDEATLKNSVTKNPKAKFVLLKIYKELLILDEFSDCSIEMLLMNLFENGNTTISSRPDWLKTVLELLNDNWNEPFSLKDLAKVANVYPTTISKYFPKYLSCTLGEYRRRLKIEKSLGFIKTSALSLTEIAYQCGFADQSHFTRTFKQMTNFLPSDYETL